MCREYIYARILLSTLIAGSACCALYADSASKTLIQDEQPPIFTAKEILPGQIIQGPGYIIENKVQVVDHDYLFKIKTELGTIPALGRNMLDLRLQEMQAIERAKELSNDPEILKGAAGSVGKTIEGTLTLLTDPVGSLKRAPKGFGRMIKSKLDSADRRAGGAKRREFAARIGCDPETRNPVLKFLLDEISTRHKIGGFAAKFIPYTGVLRMTMDIKQQVETQPPHVINERIEGELAGMGIGKYLREKFCKEEKFTTAQRLIFMSYFRLLRNIQNFDSVLKAAVEVESEAEALGIIETAKVLSGLHGKKAINRMEYRGLPIAFMADGAHVIYAPFDYVIDTREVRDAVAGYRKDYPHTPCELIVSGKVSPAAKRTFTAANIKVTENARSGW